jgi:YVTN family beta-propeller protein
MTEMKTLAFIRLSTCFILSGVAEFFFLCSAAEGAEGPGVEKRDFTPNQVGSILSWVDTGAAISAVSMHRGYLIVPMGADHGGGLGDGCLTVFDVSNLSNPVEIFDSRDRISTYQTPGLVNYFGDFAEMHHISTSGDYMLMSERHGSNGGFSILDLSKLYDASAATGPEIVSRYIYPGGSPPTNYDGYSFAPAWQGRRYVYAPTGSGGLYVIDTSDIRNPVLLRHMQRSELGNMTLRSATAIGNLLILSSAALETSFEALVLDISDPAAPRRISAFGGPLGYQGFVYGGSFYGLGKPIVRHDFTNPQKVVATTLAGGAALDLLDRQEYGFGKDDNLFIGHYAGGTKWLFSGNTLTFLNRVDSGVNPADDHAFTTPLGNVLAVTTDHANPRKLAFGVHDSPRDTTPPVPNFHSPSSGATNVSLRSRVGIGFTDFIDAGSVNTDTFRVRKIGRQESVPGTLSVKEGVVNFVPDADLDPATTYEVFLQADGVRDYAGNAVSADTLVFRFSTGEVVSEYSTRVVTAAPALVGSTVDLNLEMVNFGGQPLEHSWSFGDGTSATAYGPATSASHTYESAGNFVVNVHTRVVGQTYATAVSSVQVIHRPIPAPGPVRSSTITFDSGNALVWNVNPDNDSVSAIRATDNAKVFELNVGRDPKSLALGPGNTLWVANKKSDSISVIDRSSGAVLSTHPLPAGSAPHGIVVHPTQPRAYVSLEGYGYIAEIDTATGAILRTVDVGPWPRDMALDPLEDTLWISRFISPDDAGKLTAVNLATFATSSVVNLSHVLDPDTASGGMGLPNYLGSLAISPDYSHLYVPSKKDNIFRGLRRNGEDLTFEHAVRSMASHISLPDRTESVARRLDFDNSDFVTSLVYSPLGNLVYFVSSGSAFIWVVDAYHRRNPFSLGTGGLAPNGMAVSPDGSRLYVHNFMSRSVTVLRTSGINEGLGGLSPLEATVSTVTTEKLPPDVLRGKQIFYNSEDPRLASDSYMSCASCHLDGGHDGRVWDFSGLGEGFRNTIDLNGRGSGHGPMHWSANFDEGQDFEGQIRAFNGGSGLMKNSDFHSGTVSRSLGQSKAGISEDLDALAAYLASLTEAGRSPFRASDGSLTAEGVAGREIFRRENCASCHSGAAFTDSASLARHEVGTLAANSGERLGGELDGLDTPTLRGLWATAPYLHDGSAPSLRSVLVDRDLSGRHGNLFHLTRTEIDALVAYLKQIDDLEPSAPTVASNQPPVLASPGNQTSTVMRAANLAISASDPDGGPLTFHASGLPDGLRIDEETGVISGAPSAAARYTVQISARDPGGKSTSAKFDWEIVSYATPPVTQTYRYVKFVAKSSHDDGPFTVISDFRVLNSNGQPFSRAGWTVTADSEETSGEDGRALRALDGSDSTFWHTRWTGDNLPGYPHHLIIDMTSPRTVGGFSILFRQDANAGRVKDWDLYGSNDGSNWNLLGSGMLSSTYGEQSRFTGIGVGSILREVWSDLGAGSLAGFLAHQSYPNFPTASELRTSFEGPTDTADYYGSRMRGFLIPPASGTYRFWIASDDDSELRLSPNHEESRAVTIANAPGATTSRQWNKYPSQRSAEISLVAGRLYYIEAVQYEGHSADNLAIGWTGPGIPSITVISGQYLMPYRLASAPAGLVAENSSPTFVVAEGSAKGSLVGAVKAVSPVAGGVTYQIAGGNSRGRFAINSGSGAITVAGELDFETQPKYQLVVLSRNTTGVSLAIPVTVTIANRIESNEEAVRVGLTGPGGVFEGHGNPALIGFASDPDGDGVNNAFEILFGSNPNEANAARAIRFVPVEVAGKTHMAYEFEISSSADMAFRTLGSSDMREWRQIVAEPQLISEAAGFRTYRVVDDEPLESSTARMMKIFIDPKR